MNTLANILKTLLIKVNTLIDSINPKTQQSIKEGFYFFVFMMCIGGMICGYKMGKNSATIKTKSYVERTNDVFDIDIKLNRQQSSFKGMIDKILIEEKQLNNNYLTYKSDDNDKPIFPEQNKIEKTNKIDLPINNQIDSKPMYPDTKPIKPKNNSIKNTITKSDNTNKNKTDDGLKPIIIDDKVLE